MDCKEFEKMIPDFLEQKMDFITLHKFNEHRKQCGACKEELDIQFLVSEGMLRLEEGDSFDLQNELDVRLQEAERKIHFHNVFLYAGAVAEVLIVLGLAGIMIWMVQ